MTDQAPVEIKLSTLPSSEPRAPQKSRAIFIVVILGLLVVFLAGLRWVFAVNPDQAPFLLFSYAVGLTMIFLPCTLPLAFVIVPLSMGKSVRRGIGIALSFSLGVIITLSIYGALVGLLGDALGVGRVETAKNILYTIAGLIGIFFALGEIGLIKYRMPTYSGAAPAFIQRQQEFIKALLIGLFLGNVGVGCPNPLFNAVILPQIVVEASALHGLWIMFIHGLGRVTPLLLVAFLAILGVNATGFLVRHREKVERATGWGMIFVGGFLVLIGAFGHDGYSYSGIHAMFERITQEEVITNILGEKIKTLGHGHEIPQGEYLAYGPWVMVLLWIIPMFWWLLRERNRLRDMPPEEETKRRPYINAKTWFIISTSALLALTFGWLLPHNFVFHTVHEEMPPVFVRIIKDAVIQPGAATILRFELKDRLGEPATDLEYSHERLLHTLIVSEDFTQFWHLHPEDQTVLTQEMLKNAVFPLVHTFPRGGRYIVALDSKHKGHHVSHFEVIEVAKGPKEAGLPVITKDFSREKLFGAYTAKLSVNKDKIRHGEDTDFTYYFEKDGKPLADLEPYLGAPMHFAIMPVDLSSFAHTHGTLKREEKAASSAFIRSSLANGGDKHDSRAAVELPKAFGPEVYLYYTFPHPGLYVIFGEFKHQGKVVVTQFMVEVGIGEGGSTGVPH